MAFKDVAGNVRIKRILKMALERGRVPNSLLFCGPEGVGPDPGQDAQLPDHDRRLL